MAGVEGPDAVVDIATIVAKRQEADRPGVPLHLRIRLKLPVRLHEVAEIAVCVVRADPDEAKGRPKSTVTNLSVAMFEEAGQWEGKLSLRPNDLILSRSAPGRLAPGSGMTSDPRQRDLIQGSTPFFAVLIR